MWLGKIILSLSFLTGFLKKCDSISPNPQPGRSAKQLPKYANILERWKIKFEGLKKIVKQLRLDRVSTTLATTTTAKLSGTLNFYGQMKKI